MKYLRRLRPRIFRRRMLQTLSRIAHAVTIITREISEIYDDLLGVDRICFILWRQRHPHTISDGPTLVHVAVGPSGRPIAAALAVMHHKQSFAL